LKKVFVFSHSGVHLSGYSVVVADDTERARILLLETLKSKDLGAGNPGELTFVKQIGVYEDSVSVIFDGDY
jgi:hypothetical protein